MAGWYCSQEDIADAFDARTIKIFLRSMDLNKLDSKFSYANPTRGRWVSVHGTVKSSVNGLVDLQAILDSSGQISVALFNRKNKQIPNSKYSQQVNGDSADDRKTAFRAAMKELSKKYAVELKGTKCG